MAQKLVTVDDLDGTEGAATLTFSVDRDTWEIDLTDENADKLRDALAPFIAKARKQPKTASRRAAAGGHTRAARAWATANGMDVPARGRVPQAVMDAYVASQK